eukprot:PhM_4_TR16538/c0_g1_i1/m.53245
MSRDGNPNSNNDERIRKLRQTLQDEGLQECGDVLIAEGLLDIIDLHGVDEDELERIGVAKAFHRRRLLRLADEEQRKRNEEARPIVEGVVVVASAAPLPSPPIMGAVHPTASGSPSPVAASALSGTAPEPDHSTNGHCGHNFEVTDGSICLTLIILFLGVAGISLQIATIPTVILLDQQVNVRVTMWTQSCFDGDYVYSSKRNSVVCNTTAEEYFEERFGCDDHTKLRTMRAFAILAPIITFSVFVTEAIMLCCRKPNLVFVVAIGIAGCFVSGMFSLSVALVIDDMFNNGYCAEMEKPFADYDCTMKFDPTRSLRKDNLICDVSFRTGESQILAWTAAAVFFFLVLLVGCLRFVKSKRAE